MDTTLLIAGLLIFSLVVVVVAQTLSGIRQDGEWPEALLLRWQTWVATFVLTVISTALIMALGNVSEKKPTSSTAEPPQTHFTQTNT